MMKIFQHIRKGSGHKDFCEDYLFVNTIKQRYVVAAVFDGCSSGKDSHFASALFGKVFRNNSVKVLSLPEDELLDKEKIFNEILFKSFCEIAEVQKITGLKDDELLTTVIFMLADIVENKVKIISFGDGFISVNKQHTCIDQDNRPNYPIYHLKELTNEALFEETLKRVSQYFEDDKIDDISIATDGIESFFSQNQIVETEQAVSPIELLCEDNRFLKTSNMLARKCNILKLKHRLINWDDIAIIRLINTTTNEQNTGRTADTATTDRPS